jgi:hypothetical protein
MCHEAEQPHDGVLGSLFQTVHGRGAAGIGGRVKLHSVVGQVALLGREPFGG